MDDRLIDIEIQLTHLTRAYEQLNEVVSAQSLQLDRQQRKLDTLVAELKSLKSRPSAESPATIEDERPPHY